MFAMTARRPISRRGVIALLLISVLGISTAAAEEAFSPHEAQSGSLLLRMQSGYRVATRINTEVDIDVSGLTVRAAVRQSFRNDGPNWVEGTYVFPLPEGAAVDRMRLTIGERIIEGEIQEKAEAEARYAKARSEGKRASLVRQERANLFTTAVANIGPGETVVIDIEYLDTARFSDDTFSLRFPMTLTPRYIPGSPIVDRQGSGWSPDTDRVDDASLITPPMVTSSTDHSLTLHATVNAGMPLAHIASGYHPIDVEEADDVYEVSLKSADVAMDHDFELTWRAVPDAAPRAMLFSETRDDQPHVLMMLMPPNDPHVQVEIPPRNLVFVIDTSGSMHGVSIEQARQSLLLALDGLRPIDRFNVIQFNSVTDTLFRNSVPATTSNVSAARDYVRGLAANGGTEMRSALERALASGAGEHGDDEHLTQVIFITDGSVGNEDELFSLIEARLGASRLFTVGIGSAPNGLFMRKAAEAGRGTFVTISALHEVEDKMGSLFRKLEKPALTDVDIVWPADLEAQPYPATVPDLYAGEPVVVKARLARMPRPGDQILVSGDSTSGRWGAEVPLSAATPGPGTATVWARAHIGELMDGLRRGADEAETRAEIVSTALSHNIVSKYTSLVAVDKTPVRSQAATLAREQVPNLLPYGQDMQAMFGMSSTATIGPVYRRNGALLLGLAAIVLLLQVWTVRGPKRDED